MGAGLCRPQVEDVRMSLRDQYKNAAQQQQAQEDEERRRALFARSPTGMAGRIDAGLEEIAGKVEADIAARIQRLSTGKKETGPLTYRIEKIYGLSETTMKSTGKMKGFAALRDVCGQPGNDVRVDVVLHHGCMNTGVDVRIYPDEPFKNSRLSIDGQRVIVRKSRKAGPAATLPPAEGQIAVMKPITFSQKPGR
jgi:hypothetical protein